MTSNKGNLIVKVYTDGACSGNPGAGGWGALLLFKSEKGKEKVVIKGGEKNTTNNRMEMKAVIEAMKFVESNLKEYTIKLTIVSDSAYIVDSITENALSKWESNGWKTTKDTDVKNQDLWKEIAYLEKQLQPKFVKVKGHNGDKFNEYVDKIAVSERDKFKNMLNNI